MIRLGVFSITFADVAENDWYKPYVLTAKKLGIVNGVSDTQFGIGMNITRQDMAVMINRILDKNEVTDKSSDFVDVDDVSDYALDAVRYVKRIGLIQGYDGQFRPLDNLTRAEAAKVINSLIQLINE